MQPLTSNEIEWARSLGRMNMTTLIREKEVGKVAVVQGALVYLIMFRRFPVRALAEVGGVVLIALFMGLLILTAGVL